MASEASPDRRREVRQPAVGAVVLFPDNCQTRITGRLTDTSPSGLRAELGHVTLKPEQVTRLYHADRQGRFRIVWLKGHGRGVEVGLENHEACLINRLRAGESELFSELISPYMRSLRSRVNSILHNWADSEEAVQESLLKAAAHLHQFRLGEVFGSWLLQIATNEALKHLRRNRKYLHDTIPSDAEEEKLDKAFIDQRETPAQAFERRELLERIHNATEDLGEIYRQVFILSDLHNLKMAEVAARLGINVDTANTRLHRARMHVRAYLLDDLDATA